MLEKTDNLSTEPNSDLNKLLHILTNFLAPMGTAA